MMIFVEMCMKYLPKLLSYTSMETCFTAESLTDELLQFHISHIVVHTTCTYYQLSNIKSLQL